MKYKLVIGIDISKRTIDATGYQLENRQLCHDSFLNNQEGFKHLGVWLSGFGFEMSEALVCMEHTGMYMISLCNYLQQKGYDYSVVNPLQISRSMGIQRVKTDKKDSEIIALYASRFTEELPIGQVPGKALLQLKVMASHRDRLLKQKLAIERINQELEDTLDKGMIKQITADNIAILKVIKDKFRKSEQAIESYISEIPVFNRSYELMQSIPGVGMQIALYVMLYTHNFSRITDARKFSSYSGVVPNPRTSGTSIRGRSRVSRLANKKMKSLLHYGAFGAIKYDHQLKAYYQRKVKEGKPKMSAINAVRNKLVHRIFSVVRRGTPYVNQPVF